MTEPLKHRNWIGDTNPFGLAAPPIWWLNGLAAFDTDLVVMPSRQRPVYWLARYRTLSAAYAPKLELDLLTDSAMFRAHGVIDVTWFASMEGFTDGLLLYLCNELAARDTWAVNGRPMTQDDMKASLFNGGTTKYTKLLDEQDKAAEAKIVKDNRDNLWHATGEAWRLKQALTGERLLASGMPSAPPSTASAAVQDAPLVQDAELSA